MTDTQTHVRTYTCTLTHSTSVTGIHPACELHSHNTPTHTHTPTHHSTVSFDGNGRHKCMRSALSAQSYPHSVLCVGIPGVVYVCVVFVCVVCGV